MRRERMLKLEGAILRLRIRIEKLRQVILDEKLKELGENAGR